MRQLQSKLTVICQEEQSFAFSVEPPNIIGIRELRGNSIINRGAATLVAAGTNNSRGFVKHQIGLGPPPDNLPIHANLSLRKHSFSE
jgi:hypothetical protein